MKKLIKKLLAFIGVLHPALGEKVNPQRKVEILLSYRNSGIFVETGTEFGATLEALKPHFDTLYSVELDESKFHVLTKKFASDPHIHLYRGDSAQILREILATINDSALIWLDAHTPGEITLQNSPVRAELEAIFNHPHHHTVLIDDARHFNRRNIRHIKREAKKHGYRYELSEGIFRLT